MQRRYCLWGGSPGSLGFLGRHQEAKGVLLLGGGESGKSNGSLFIPKTVILETSRLHFGVLSDLFGDPGVHRDTKQAT